MAVVHVGDLPKSSIIKVSFRVRSTVQEPTQRPGMLNLGAFNTDEESYDDKHMQQHPPSTSKVDASGDSYK